MEWYPVAFSVIDCTIASETFTFPHSHFINSIWAFVTDKFTVIEASPSPCHRIHAKWDDQSLCEFFVIFQCITHTSLEITACTIQAARAFQNRCSANISFCFRILQAGLCLVSRCCSLLLVLDRAYCNLVLGFMSVTGRAFCLLSHCGGTFVQPWRGSLSSEVQKVSFNSQPTKYFK